MDDFGFLWRGPCAGEVGFRYLRFERFTVDGDAQWVWRLYASLPDFYEITFDRAFAALKLHFEDAFPGRCR